jgi:putative ABC transport system permease protein
VARRTREIGIRMALGAQRGDVLALVMKQAALQTALGITAGVMLALLAGEALSKMLFRVNPFDPLALAAAALLLSAAALLACFLPARRATRVDPSSALRAE